MKNRHTGGIGRHFSAPDDRRDDQNPRGNRRGHGRGRPRGRLFDYGDLRLLVLAMIAERPRHGYELIKAIEDRFGGSYSPSPGVIYPTLSWLEDMGYTAIEPEVSGRKLHRITSEGEAFLLANRAAADELLARVGTADASGASDVPASVVRAMENLKLAMRLRLKGRPLDEAAADEIASALDAAARTVERS